MWGQWCMDGRGNQDIDEHMDREADTKAVSETMRIELSGGKKEERNQMNHHIKCAHMRFIHLHAYLQLTVGAAPAPYPYLPYALGGGTVYVTPPPTVVTT